MTSQMTEQYLETALAACRAAVDVHRHHLGRLDPDAWVEKRTADFVTQVDREAEERIVDKILARFPDHRILAEEGTGADAGAGEPGEDDETPVWIIDPLDGTTNYLHRYPAYAVSIALVRGGEPIVGAVVSGATGEAWTARRGAGAFHDGRPIRVSEVDSMRLALIGTGFPFKARHLLPRYMRQFPRVLSASAGVRRAGSAALDLCHLASGMFDGFWELDLAPWDIAAGTLIAREAGAVVTSVDGPIDILRGGSVLAGNPAIHRQLETILAEADPHSSEEADQYSSS